MLNERWGDCLKQPHSWLAGLCIALALAGCDDFAPAATFERRYAAWLALHDAEVDEYRVYLQQQGVGDVMPMPQLLRSARRWRLCRASEFAVPPPLLRSNLVATLSAVKQMKQERLLQGSTVASVFRGRTLNRCAGGSSKSRHLSNNALDLDLIASPRNIAELCAYWRKHGAGLKLGLGFYTPTRIHLDTSGFRTWGQDHSRKTSLCIRQDRP